MNPLLIHQAMSDETRVRILLALQIRSLCVCELTELLNISQTNISKHLAKLRDWGLVTTSRRERFIEYSIEAEQEYLFDVLDVTKKHRGLRQEWIDDEQRVLTHTCVACNPKLAVL
jgi:ArsR family transcriptional regulator